jgi:hypothetical protein
MNFLSQNKGIIIGIVLVVALFVGYAILRPAPESMDGGGLDMNVVNANPAGGLATSDDPSSLLIFQLLSIQSIVFDTKFFQDPVYRELVDQSRPLGERDVGRPNPFLDIGKNPASANGAVQTTTIGSPATTSAQFTQTSTGPSTITNQATTTSPATAPRATTTNSRR